MVKALALASLLALAACQTAGKGTFCAISHPVRLSDTAVDALSDAEVAALLAHNEKGAKLCAWRP